MSEINAEIKLSSRQLGRQAWDGMIDGASPEIWQSLTLNEIMFIFPFTATDFPLLRWNDNTIPRTKTDPGVVIEVSGRVTGLVVAGRVWGCLHVCMFACL